MNIYLFRNEQYTGPYTEAEVMSRVKSGACAKTDLAWCDGCTEPAPVIDLLCRPSATPTTPPPQVYSVEELIAIAQNYRWLLGTAIVWVVTFFVPMSESFERLWVLSLTGCWIRSGWILARSLHRRPWVWVIWSFIPLGNFYALVRILCDAARTLKANGIPCGFFGADSLALARLQMQTAPPSAAGSTTAGR